MGGETGEVQRNKLTQRSPSPKPDIAVGWSVQRRQVAVRISSSATGYAAKRSGGESVEAIAKSNIIAQRVRQRDTQDKILHCAFHNAESLLDRAAICA